jgi:hypothetical protein
MRGAPPSAPTASASATRSGGAVRVCGPRRAWTTCRMAPSPSRAPGRAGGGRGRRAGRLDAAPRGGPAPPKAGHAMTRRGPHEGSIHLRKDGRWAGSVHIGWIDGKRVRKHVLGKTRGEVASELEALLRAKRENRPIPDRRAKLGPFLRTWLDEVAKPRSAPRPSGPTTPSCESTSRARARSHPSGQTVASRCPGLHQPEGSDRPVTTPGGDDPRRPAPSPWSPPNAGRW